MTPPDLSAETLLAQASAALEAGDSPTAIDLLRGAIRSDPANAVYHFQLGNVFAHEDRQAEADEQYREAFRLDPKIVEFPLGVGVECARSGMLQEAEGCLRLALSFDHHNPTALIHLGDVLRRQGREGEAIPLLEAARNLAPNSADAWLNLGIALQQADRLADASAAFEAALRVAPANPLAMNALAMTRKQMGETAEALALMEEVVRAAPNFAEGRLNRAMLLLLAGDFARGWSEYEWRPKAPLVGGRGLREHLQAGLPTAGKTVLLHAEQGLGDLIQFVRYAGWLHERGARVIVECRAHAHELIRRASGVAGVIAPGEIAEFDLEAHLLSLPGIVHPHEDALRAEVPYLHADPGRVATRKDRPGRDGRPRVGLVWAGNPDRADGRRRSIPFAALRPILDLPNVDVYSLQLGPAAAEFNRADREWGVADLAETAAMIMCLDLIISVDTMAAHLAGALGRPVWTLLPAAPDWRWGLEREDTPWYPTMRLFRQSRPGDYSSVVQRVVEVLLKGDVRRRPLA
jgi:tetratricopeptide (TPR) repeat protein